MPARMRNAWRLYERLHEQLEEEDRSMALAGRSLDCQEIEWPIIRLGEMELAGVGLELISYTSSTAKSAPKFGSGGEDLGAGRGAV